MSWLTIICRGHWFWIDDRDQKTKRAFAFMMFLFTLADTGERENLPLITIPARSTRRGPLAPCGPALRV